MTAPAYSLAGCGAGAIIFSEGNDWSDLTHAAKLFQPAFQHWLMLFFHVQKFDTHSDARLHDSNHDQRL
jgi:hypothetical protein